MAEESGKLEREQTKPNDDVSKGLEAVICDPLKHSWTFWLDAPSAKWRQAARGSSVRPVHTFSNVEVFRSLDNNVHHPSKLTRGAHLYCFKNHIVPNWEDPNPNGGRWTATFQKGKSDNAWMQSLLVMIREQFDYGDEICGAEVNVRGWQDRISLWTKNAANEAAQLSIGKQWKEFLDYNEKIGFIFHVDAKRLDRNAKKRYFA